MFRLGHEKIKHIIEQLDHAVENHQLWFQNINRSLACRVPCKPEDLMPDSYRKCEFGEWYYQSDNEPLQRHDGFNAIENIHIQMHVLATELLLSSQSSTSSNIDKYDQFAKSVERLRMQIMSLQHELQSSLFNVDTLTSARTRSGMLTELRQQHELVKRNAFSCCIAMMDFDHFKHINDSHGHQEGDMVLKTVIRYILDNIRPFDMIFRYGGEEFLLCLPGTDVVTANYAVERLRSGIENLAITGSDSGELRITVSFGMSALSNDIYIEESINRADKALYHAKASGRNRSVAWENLDTDSIDP
ncbi:MAG: diguanylate cyclase [gamma proteobacterium symbiont of Ctena orbiculata]|uniref:diguanylate cyclase n=1 Tax=Candidatus Thiodiazotropha taylori TaxID=2792791 RepID=A0A944MAV4_9GAMM|nr:diguanylate cyclase [Candidatus Thiodiazotropha taylori]PUB83667.1 MAG: diguanylate cyclase [gamma proteobacterium symbiont of Ctena orbiculata]MBT2988017.1 diguanylate cyclase [Candidatus Thiodiazotropha taylori]MBT2997662.1 diguanylate cyclase [Candidatus Thiodiazotropha taylori]MBT3001917.1 diguanylate cyclase [Candidatus Thiodiazotropha taylori]